MEEQLDDPRRRSASSVTAPASFKGFGDTILGTPPNQFTTRPGNSSNPPPAPLPDQMCVWSPTWSISPDPTITGDIVGWALVSTEPGYDSNPGHAGTGTVIAFSSTSCPSAGGDGGGLGGF